MPYAFSPFPNITNAFYAPLSGDVSQDIEPRVFSPDIAGDAATEHRIHRNVASYGTQLGKILEALQILADKVDHPLPEIATLIDGVEAEKADQKATLRREAEEALARLKAVDEAAWQEVRE